MATATQQNMFLAEPVQWAREYLLDILETLNDSADDEHCLALLSLEREELRQVWHSVSADGRNSGPVFCCFGRNAFRLFVIHQLLAAMPAVTISRPQSNSGLLGTACRRFLELHFFLSLFTHPLNEGRPETSETERSLLAAARLLQCSAKDGQRLHLYCPDYRLPAPAYYLPFSDSVLCETRSFGKGEFVYSLFRNISLARQKDKRATFVALGGSELLDFYCNFKKDVPSQFFY